VLRHVDGVTGVSPSAYTGTDLNRMNINLYVHRPDFNNGQRKQVITKCSRDVPNKLTAARLAKQKLGAMLGEDAVRAAEEQVAAASASASTEAASTSQRSVGAVLGMTQQLQGELRAAELRAARELQLVRAAEAAHNEAQEQVAAARAALESHQKRQRIAPEQVSCRRACGVRAQAPGSARATRTPHARELRARACVAGRG